MIRHSNFFKSHSLHQQCHSPIGIAYTSMKAKVQPAACKKNLEGQFDCIIMRAGKKKKAFYFHSDSQSLQRKFYMREKGCLTHRILVGRSTTTPIRSQPAQAEESGKTLMKFTIFQHELTQIQKTADTVLVCVLCSECHWERAGNV